MPRADGEPLMRLAAEGTETAMTTRRAFIAAVIPLFGVGLSGCGGRDDGAATPTTDGSGAIREATLESGEGECGDEASAEITETADGIQVSGEILAGTPCHRAVLEDSGVAEGTARFRIGVEPDRETEACVQCIGGIPFDLSARLADRVDTVAVELGGNDPTTVRKRLS